MSIKYPIENPYTLSVDEIVQTFQTNAASGITQSEAEQRTKEFGQNIYQTQKQKSIWLMMLLQFKSPIVYLLFFAVAVTMYFQDYIEAIAILVVIFTNAVIGFFMELQARSSMNALKEMDVILSNIIRDGKVQDVPSESIVPGDIIVLEAGDVVPADARLLEVNQLQCDESSLTGESLPTEKHTDVLSQGTVLGDQVNMVFKGTAVMNGNGKALVTGIAENTQLGVITSLVDTSKDEDTPLDKKISALSKKLIWITLVMTSIFAITGFIQGKEWVLILETSIALAVAAFPEGLPIVSTVALAYGMLLMAKRNAIVKKLSAVETLGSTNVILTDKTGTLTENKIYVDTFCFPEETKKVSIENNELKFNEGNLEKSQDAFYKLRLIGALCNNASLKNIDGNNQLFGDPIEIGLVELANASGSSSDELKGQYERIGEVPFNSDIKIMATLHNGPSGSFVAAKGSVESLLEKCSKMYVGTELRDLTEEDRKKILAESEQMQAMLKLVQ